MSVLVKEIMRENGKKGDFKHKNKCQPNFMISKISFFFVFVLQKKQRS